MRNKLSEWMQKDWFLKVLALCLAVMLWFYAESEQNPNVSRNFDVPVQVINLADNYVVDDANKTVRVNVRGKSTDLSSMRREDIVALVDMSDAQVGAGSYPVKVTVPGTVERYTVSPNDLSMAVDILREAQVPIKAVTTGMPATGYHLQSVEVIPEQADIYGKSQIVNILEQLETEPVDISGMTGETVLEAKLKAPAGLLVSSGNTVIVRLHIQEDQGTENFAAPIVMLNVPAGLKATLSQNTANVLLKGNQSLLNDKEELEKIVLYVDCNGIETGATEIPLQLHYGGELEILQIEPGSIMVTAVESVLQETPDVNTDNTADQPSVDTEHPAEEGETE